MLSKNRAATYATASTLKVPAPPSGYQPNYRSQNRLTVAQRHTTLTNTIRRKLNERKQQSRLYTTEKQKKKRSYEPIPNRRGQIADNGSNPTHDELQDIQAQHFRVGSADGRNESIITSEDGVQH